MKKIMKDMLIGLICSVMVLAVVLFSSGGTNFIYVDF